MIYINSEIDIRPDIPATQSVIWARLGRPGTWWAGAERLAIADEVRHATDCDLCKRRKDALSPYTITGDHTTSSVLPEAAVEIIHRIRTDAGRLTRSWFDKVTAQGISEGQYAEIVVILALTVGSDSFARALGVEPLPLPAPIDGEPTRKEPAGLRAEGGYIRVIEPGKAGPSEDDLFNQGTVPNIHRSISLVPDIARDYYRMSESLYLPADIVPRARENGGRALTRPQMEFLATRVSALNGCFF